MLLETARLLLFILLLLKGELFLCIKARTTGSSSHLIHHSWIRAITASTWALLRGLLLHLHLLHLLHLLHHSRVHLAHVLHRSLGVWRLWMRATGW
jgi:hypothetical protein